MSKTSTITERLSRISLLTCGTALLVACLCLFGFQIYTFHSKFICDTNALAAGVAKSSSFVIEAEDMEAAESALAPLKSQSNVLTVAFLKPDQQVFYALGHADKLNLPAIKEFDSGYVFSGLQLVVRAPVIRNQEVFGHLVLISD